MTPPTRSAADGDGRLLPNDALIRSTPLAAAGRHRVLPLLLLAWVVSAIVHIVLLVVFALVTIGSSSAGPSKAEPPIQTLVEDDKPKEDNLVNDDIGNNPDELLNFNIKRVEDVSLPGPLNPAEAPGMNNAPEALPVNVPPPPGLGGSEGQGGGIPTPKLDGVASPIGAAGGMQGFAFPGVYKGRSGATREEMLREGGGNSESEAAVARGLKWLADHQAADGHWSLDGFDKHQGGRCNCNGFGHNDNIAGTAFGLLPMLAAGETHKNAKSVYRANVDRGLKYLMLKQSREGNFGGTMYSHGLATIAICEAYGMTADPSLKSSAQRAINFIRSAQAANGGWRYEPKEPGDTSVTGWQVMALKSGQMAGLEVDDPRNPTLAKASRFLDSCMAADGSGYGYQGPDPSPTMSAVGLLCRLYLGTGTRNSGVVAGVSRLKQTPPPSGINSIYYYYYATQVMYHVGGETWQAWNIRMRDALIKRQDQGQTPKHPHLRGSWSPAGDIHGGAGGRLMTTSLSLLTLEVYYRHLPLYKRNADAGKMTAGKG